MMKILFFFLMILLSFIMFFLNHPLSLGLMILMQTMILCLLSGMMIYSYWFSYILFLTFMGGLLVLFIYMSSIASNELFKINIFNKFLILITTPIMIFFSIYLMNNLNYMFYMMNSDMINMFNVYMFINIENNINLSKLYNEQTYLMMMMMITYLFITLIAVIKITNIFFGPLRSFN